MSTNLKTVDVANLTYKVIYDSTLTNAAIIDVTQASGYLYDIAIENTDAGDRGVLKICLTSSEPVVGTTTPDIQLFVLPSTTIRVVIPGGVPFSKLSMWQTTDTAASATASTSTAFAVWLTTS